MNTRKILFVLIGLLLAGVGNAWAGGRVYGGVGIYLGGPGPYWGWGPAYPRPYYYPGFYPYPGPYYEAAPVVVVPAAPPVYIEQNDAAAVEQDPEGTQYWYFCRRANNYYPYVKECPGGWQKVPPRPAQ